MSADGPTTGAVTPWWTLEPADAAARLDASLDGLSASEAASRLASHGRNELTAAKAATFWQLALRQLADPMNLMLVAVTAISAAIGQVSTAIMVGLLVVFNVLSGASQERKAQASVDALATMQVPQVRVRRDGAVTAVPAPELVPGDVIELEAGDIVPADARIVRASALETQEAALTGESAPIEKSAAALADPATALGDRASMLFQNTSVTRGTATALVVATGMSTEMGAIATMLADVERVPSPLQRELGSLTRVMGLVAWGAVAVIVLIGIGRGQSFADLMFLGTAVAISAIPTGLPTYVQMMLSWGASRLAEAKAVVASLNDVETLGATSAICSDKTGTLTMNEMMARSVWVGGETFTVDGAGYSFDGRVRRSQGDEVPLGAPIAYALALPNDATVSADGVVVGDPTEAAFVVLAEKLGVDVPEVHRRFPREAEVPFDSDYKFMATFHHVQWQGERRLIGVVKGAPDVLLSRSARAFLANRDTVPIDEVADAVTDEIEHRSSQGLRTLALALRVYDVAEEDAVIADPMAAVSELGFVGVVGIVDPLRPEAKVAVDEAHAAGIDVRMITGDHVVTATAIGRELDLPGEGMSGAEFAALSDAEVDARLDRLSVFGRVTPQDKLRLVQRLQARGEVVAMTGDAVNDAAAIKQADIGVAMGSGSEVTKQAAKLVLTDDNFATLVHAVHLGRVVYGKIAAYITFQLSQLIALVLLFLMASLVNLNEGVALTPVQVLVLNFAAAGFAVVVILLEPSAPGLMQRPPRDPAAGVASRANVVRWLIYGGALFVAASVPLIVGSDELSPDEASQPMTMAFVVVALGTLTTGLQLRRDPETGLRAPWGRGVRLLLWPVGFVILATELPFLAGWMVLSPLTGLEWIACLLLVGAVMAVIEGDMAIRRRREVVPTPTVAEAVAPRRAR
ncbi:cation-translocating P-type ATPase [Demequina lignilytica]|uniref:Cation-transporting P-type ATPase n=1 Tax=Demequina lignilytica TaxID=3051663 RepID=A0AAW7M1X5_9MICO|nr:MULTISPECIES: cation-transporting P-type ATPase [unclassified Demequina]MDN4478371.1 cation-transporting P-type ATPase [Demequina sp. SYSU T00039-1]MDN4482469.1 cation-transporting P-type ATPase [Demequina sp. SYSU T0a273]MDN4487122.1 cation-transporting P-type ATPase [Demequina sp. SYSU T00039]MDN4489833.1 cation-transporting P-type ATPase [Demequina sp. SYSU T00068]